jgi:hypothetical protein
MYMLFNQKLFAGKVHVSEMSPSDQVLEQPVQIVFRKQCFRACIALKIWIDELCARYNTQNIRSLHLCSNSQDDKTEITQTDIIRVNPI